MAISQLKNTKDRTYFYYANSIREEGVGASWVNLPIGQLPDSLGTHSKPQGSGSGSAYRPKNLIWGFSRDLSKLDANWKIGSINVYLNLKTTSANREPTIRVFKGSPSQISNNNLLCTVKSSSSRTATNDGYSRRVYKLTNVSLKDLMNCTVSAVWDKTTSTGVSDVGVGYLAFGFTIVPRQPKWKIIGTLSKDEVIVGEKLTWKVTVTQTGDGGTIQYRMSPTRSAKVLSQKVSTGTLNDSVWTLSLASGKSATYTCQLEATTLGTFDNIVKNTGEIKVDNPFTVTYTLVDGVNLLLHDTYENTNDYFDITFKGTSDLLNHEYMLTALCDCENKGLLNIIDMVRCDTLEVLSSSNIVDGTLISNDNDYIKFDLVDEGDFELTVRVPIYSLYPCTPTVTVTRVYDGVILAESSFNIFEKPPLFLMSSSEKGYFEQFNEVSFNIGCEDVQTIRCKSHRHNFFEQDDDILNLNIEDLVAYIGNVRLERCHSNDVTANVKNTLIRNRYQNRAYYGKKGDYTEAISMKLRIPPKDVATLEGLVEFDKPIPIDTIPSRMDGDPLNHRGWAELYEINNIKKVNSRLYDCEPVVEYITHEINTTFTVKKGDKVYPSSEEDIDHPPINTFLTQTHNYGDNLNDKLLASPYDFVTNMTTNEGYASVYQIPVGNKLNYYSSGILPSNANWDIRFRNSLPSEDSEDYDNNWTMAIRLLDGTKMLFEHLYLDYAHRDEDNALNQCVVKDTYWNGNEYETISHENMSLNIDDLAPLLGSQKGKTSIQINNLPSYFEDNGNSESYNRNWENTNMLVARDSYNTYLNSSDTNLAYYSSYEKLVDDFEINFQYSVENSNINNNGFGFGDSHTALDYSIYANALGIVADTWYDVKITRIDNALSISTREHNDEEAEEWVVIDTDTLEGEVFFHFIQSSNSGGAVGCYRDLTIHNSYDYNKNIIITLNHIVHENDASPTEDTLVPIPNQSLKITLTNRDGTYVEKWDKMTNLMGKVSIPSSWSEDDYNLTVVFDETSEYLPCDYEADFTIDYTKQPMSFICLEADPFTTVDEIYDAQVGYFDIDGEYVGVSNIECWYSFADIDSDVFTAPQSVVSDTVDGVDGVLGIPINYNNGMKKLKLWFKGDDDYVPCTVIQTILINIPNNYYTIEADDVEYQLAYWDNIYTAIVKRNGNVVTNQPVTVRLYRDDDIITLNKVTDEDGYLRLDIDLPTGLWNIDLVVGDGVATTTVTHKITVFGEKRVATELNFDEMSLYDYLAEYGFDLKDACPKVIINSVTGDDPTYCEMEFTIKDTDGTILWKGGNNSKDSNVCYIPYYEDNTGNELIFECHYKGDFYHEPCTRTFRTSTPTTPKSKTLYGVTTDYYGDKPFIKVLKDSSTALNDMDVVISVSKDGTNLDTFNIRTMSIGNTYGAYIPSFVGDLTISVAVADPSSNGYQGATFVTELEQTEENPLYDVEVLSATGGNTNYLGVLHCPFDSVTMGVHNDNDKKVKLRIPNNDGVTETVYYANTYYSNEQLRTYCDILYDPTCRSGNCTAILEIYEKDGSYTTDELNLRAEWFGVNTLASSNVQLTGFSNNSFQDLTLTCVLNSTSEVIIDANHLDSQYSLTFKTYMSDSGILNLPLNLFNGNWGITVRNNNHCSENYAESIASYFVTVDDPTVLLNSLPTRDGEIIVTPSQNDNLEGVVFGSDVSLDLRDGKLNLIDYGMVQNTTTGTSGKIILNDINLNSTNLSLEIEIGYANTLHQRLNELEGLLQVQTLENVQADINELNMYRNMICSPSPIPNNHCYFTRHGEDGTLYYYDAKELKDDKGKIYYGVNYICSPYNNYKGGVDITTESGISLFNTENNFSPLYINNGLVRLGYHRKSGYVTLERYNELNDTYVIVNVIKLSNTYKLTLENYSDDKITVKYGDTLWTMWRGHPYIQVQHNNTNLDLLRMPNRVYCETVVNNRSLGYLEEEDIYCGKFIPNRSLQLFKKELHIGENINTDNFRLNDFSYDSTRVDPYWIDLYTGEGKLESIIEPKTDDFALHITSDSACAINFPLEGDFIDKPSSTFSVLLDNIRGTVPSKLKLRGFENTDKMPIDGSDYQVGAYSQVQDITVTYDDVRDTERGRAFVTFNNVPSTIKCIDFVLIYDTTDVDSTINRLMLQDGDMEMEYSVDTSEFNAYQTEIAFDKTYYCNYFNEYDDYGLCIMRPKRDSITLKSITASSLTILAPYFKRATDHDAVNKLLLEYINQNEQTIGVNWFGGI